MILDFVGYLAICFICTCAAVCLVAMFRPDSDD